MNKKTLVLAIIAALGIGGAGTIAYQTHAQQTSDTVTAPVVANQAVTPPAENTKTDTDNIQDDKGAVDKPDAPINNEQADKETNDDKATSTVQTGDNKEQNEGTAKDANEKEDSN